MDAPSSKAQPSDDLPTSRRCIRCATVYPGHLVWWVFRAHRAGHDYRKRVCRACEQTARDQRKQRNRLAVKARDALRRHAARLGIDQDELITVYGWDPQQLARDAEYQYAGWCSYCDKPYAGMGNGLSDITIDIQDRDRPPYYRTNTTWCCRTCNGRKGVMTPEEFEADRQMWMLWARSASEPPEQGMLF